MKEDFEGVIVGAGMGMMSGALIPLLIIGSILWWVEKHIFMVTGVYLAGNVLIRTLFWIRDKENRKRAADAFQTLKRIWKRKNFAAQWYSYTQEVRKYNLKQLAKASSK